MDLSFIVVTKNNIVGLIKTVDSILNQVNRNKINFEIIVVDSLSNDGSYEAIMKLHCDKIIYIYEIDKGIYDAMNKGLKISSGEFVWFLNAGDYIIGEVLSEITLTPSFLIRYYVNKFGKKSSFIYPIWYGMPTSHQAVIYKKTSLKYDTRFKYCADYIFTIINVKKYDHKKQFTSGYVLYDTTGLSNKKYFSMMFEKNQINIKYYFQFYPIVFFVDIAKIIYILLFRFIMSIHGVTSVAFGKIKVF